MQIVQVYHEAAASSLDSILRDGLQYGTKGEYSREEAAAKTNELLDQLCPAKLLCLGVSRQNCLYGYLALHGWVIDTKTGRPMAPADWNPGADRCKLALYISPKTAYVSDLDRYDALARAVQSGAPATKLRKLANIYWQYLLPLKDVLAHYQLSKHGIIATPDARPDLPRRLGRIEVLITESVPPEHIKQS